MQNKHHLNLKKKKKTGHSSLSVIFRFHGKGSFYLQIHLTIKQTGYAQSRKTAADKIAWDSISTQSMVIVYGNLFWFLPSFPPKKWALLPPTYRNAGHPPVAIWVLLWSPLTVPWLLHLCLPLLLHFMLSFLQLPFELNILATLILCGAAFFSFIGYNMKIIRSMYWAVLSPPINIKSDEGSHLFTSLSKWT